MAWKLKTMLASSWMKDRECWSYEKPVKWVDCDNNNSHHIKKSSEKVTKPASEDRESRHDTSATPRDGESRNECTNINWSDAESKEWTNRAGTDNVDFPTKVVIIQMCSAWHSRPYKNYRVRRRSRWWNNLNGNEGDETMRASELLPCMTPPGRVPSYIYLSDKMLGAPANSTPRATHRLGARSKGEEDSKLQC
ncbi:hypothetical protein BDN70DRAFT_902082 [Pholiota conissans]|uniref:Uncharacterized protein n=1 Tax=Pholiota conissans TaxID=109636 RepID=A0A9P6CLB3_9AGAR|nr:hypothetical protein BDN70DRAFT_902082 [Pholiota conissans]